MNATPIPKKRQNFNKMDRANKKKETKDYLRCVGFSKSCMVVLLYVNCIFLRRR